MFERVIGDLGTTGWPVDGPRCSRCGRVMKDDHPSGMGPHCRRLSAQAKARAAQLELDLHARSWWQKTVDWLRNW